MRYSKKYQFYHIEKCGENRPLGAVGAGVFFGAAHEAIGGVLRREAIKKK